VIGNIDVDHLTVVHHKHTFLDQWYDKVEIA